MQGGMESGEKSRQLSWKLMVFRNVQGEGILGFSNVGCGLCRKLWAGDSPCFAAPQLKALWMCGRRVRRIPA